MLDTDIFLNRLQLAGYTHFCVVPCSFSKYLINAVINNGGSIEYLPCASEAVACSVAAGLAMSGKHPLVVVQSSGLSNMVSCLTSLLKPYDIYIPIIISWRTYKKGDSEIQHAHLATKLPDLVSACGYRYEMLDQSSEENAVRQLVNCEEKHQMLLLTKSTFSTVTLNVGQQYDLSMYPKRSEYLTLLNERYAERDVVFIGTTGNTSREMRACMRDTRNFYMAGNMGGALSIGLGAAKAGHRVIVCGGDAEFVMHMGALATTGRYADVSINLVYLLFDNESNKSTGGQCTYQAHVNYSAIAAACGASVFPMVDKTDLFMSSLAALDKEAGFMFLHIKAAFDEDMLRPLATEIKSSQHIFR
jgi:phosphonopyruvate decarboxylase